MHKWIRAGDYFVKFKEVIPDLDGYYIKFDYLSTDLQVATIEGYYTIDLYSMFLKEGKFVEEDDLHNYIISKL